DPIDKNLRRRRFGTGEVEITVSIASESGSATVDATRVWSEALGILADHAPMSYWRMANGAGFWWTLTGREQLLADRFADEPFGFSQIESVTAFREVRYWGEVMSCDWPSLREALAGVEGLEVTELTDVELPPATPPNQAVRLVASSVGGTSGLSLKLD